MGSHLGYLGESIGEKGFMENFNSVYFYRSRSTFYDNNRFVQFRSRKKVELGLILLGSMLFLSINSVSGYEKPQQPHENLNVGCILELSELENGNGGFTDGSTSSVNWYDTLDALKGLELRFHNLQ